MLDPIAEKHGVSLQQLALAWQLHRSENMLPIPGTTSLEHLKENLAAAATSLTQDEVDPFFNHLGHAHQFFPSLMPW
ncbi:aldo/keto reductase [Ktedonobacter robiniae]|uniref:NADP-dependent oxidoreductase domain-containing protein n=1 Tax=Ktedonobacter robiniae TaxID=2778365 RepID=A0ABQ3UWR9_9CHLR|nr:hypothetical protein KSB_53070 [Ktedonobacter robiniae]